MFEPFDPDMLVFSHDWNSWWRLVADDAASHDRVTAIDDELLAGDMNAFVRG